MIAVTEKIEEDLIGNVTTINSVIDSENINFVFELVSSRLYSDPIGSICRELAANCYDAHIEAEITDPIIINLERDIENDSYYIEFCDKGLGINEEKFQKTYMSWFNSTKRMSNKFKGYYGIGSKVPLSYTDYFYITTTSKGYTTKYVLSKSSDGPKADKLIDTHYTGQPNGTIIRVDLKTSSDLGSFVYALKQQLCYFEDIYIKSNWYIFDNHFRIYEANTFKFRSNTPYTNMHILLGSAVYPIDFSKLEIPIIEIPVGIKFEIGELFVTPSREALEYTSESKKLILDRIEACKLELIERFNKQNPEVTDLIEYWKKKDETSCITFSPEYDSTIKDKLIIKGLKLKTKAIYGPLKEMEMPNYPLFEYQYYSFNKNKVDKSVYNISTVHELTKCSNYYFTDKTNTYSNAFLESGIIVVNKEIGYKEICRTLKLNSNRATHRIYGEGENWYQRVSNNRNGYGKDFVKRPQLGTAQLIYKYRKVMRDYMVNLCKVYPIMSQEWIDNYKREQRDNSRKQYLKENQILFYSTTNSKREEIKFSELEKSLKVFYIKKEEDNNVFTRLEELTNTYYKTFKMRSKKKGNLTFLPNPPYLYKFIILNDTNYKIAKNLSNLVHISEYWKTKELQPLFNRLYYAYRFNELSYTLRKYNIALISNYYENLSNKFKNFCAKYYNNQLYYFQEEFKKIPVKNHPCTWEIRKIKKELQIFVEKAEILRYIDNYIPETHLKKIVKTISLTKLNNHLYGN